MIEETENAAIRTLQKRIEELRYEITYSTEAADKMEENAAYSRTQASDAKETLIVLTDAISALEVRINREPKKHHLLCECNLCKFNSFKD